MAWGDPPPVFWPPIEANRRADMSDAAAPAPTPAEVETNDPFAPTVTPGDGITTPETADEKKARRTGEIRITIGQPEYATDEVFKTTRDAGAWLGRGNAAPGQVYVVSQVKAVLRASVVLVPVREP